MLDGLTRHGTDLVISEHYTDTGGTTDHVFAKRVCFRWPKIRCCRQAVPKA